MGSGELLMAEGHQGSVAGLVHFRLAQTPFLVSPQVAVTIQSFAASVTGMLTIESEHVCDVGVLIAGPFNIEQMAAG